MNRTAQGELIVQTDDLVEDVCWRLVSTATIARVGFASDDGMQILPVNFALLGHMIVFRTAKGSMLDALGGGSPVVVEIDHVDPPNQVGWSVVVRGAVEKVNRDLLPLVGNSVHPWANGERDVWLWVRPQRITGRSISRHLVKTEFRLPYMSPD